MCKWLRDILFPTNILGKKKQCVAVSWADTPEVDGYKSFDVVFYGEYCEISYTRSVRRGDAAPIVKTVYFPERTSMDSEDHYERLEIMSGIHGAYVNRCSDIFFKVTNCESLEVNGVKLI